MKKIILTIMTSLSIITPFEKLEVYENRQGRLYQNGLDTGYQVSNKFDDYDVHYCLPSSTIEDVGLNLFYNSATKQFELFVN